MQSYYENVIECDYVVMILVVYSPFCVTDNYSSAAHIPAVSFFLIVEAKYYHDSA